MAAPQPEAHDPDEQGRMTLMQHLAELRSRLIKSLLAVAAGGVLGFIFYPQIFDLLIDPYCDIPQVADSPAGCNLVIRAPLDGFNVRLRISGYAGLFLASPVVLWQIWRFVTPGLYDKERRLAVPFVLSSVVLFLSGAALAFWTVPRALDFLLTIGGDDLTPLLEPVEYLRFITLMMVVFGLGFEFPVLLVFLMLAGALSVRRLRQWRRYTVVIIVVLVAVITPSGDPWSLAALSIPMYVFYEVSILIGHFIERRRRAREEAES